MISQREGHQPQIIPNVMRLIRRLNMIRHLLSNQTRHPTTHVIDNQTPTQQVSYPGAPSFTHRSCRFMWSFTELLYQNIFFKNRLPKIRCLMFCPNLGEKGIEYSSFLSTFINSFNVCTEYSSDLCYFQINKHASFHLVLLYI